jgi:very-short-patch-repair endonuclease
MFFKFTVRTARKNLINSLNVKQELNKTMYFRATRTTLNSAKMLRENMTLAEKILWERLKGKQISGLRFRRQHPIEFYIADFYCHKARLVIELDGEIHSQQVEYDDGRSADIEKFGIKVIRFTNTEVEDEIGRVVCEIIEEVNQRLNSPTWDQ